MPTEVSVTAENRLPRDGLERPGTLPRILFYQTKAGITLFHDVTLQGTSGHFKALIQVLISSTPTVLFQHAPTFARDAALCDELLRERSAQATRYHQPLPFVALELLRRAVGLED